MPAEVSGIFSEGQVIRLGDLSLSEAAGSDRPGTHHSSTAGPYQGGTSIHPGPGDFLAQCHTPGRCPHGELVHTLPLPVWAPA